MHKTPKTAKITKKYNGHTRGKFVLIILLKKKRGYFKVFSVINQRYFISHTTSYKELKLSRVGTKHGDGPWPRPWGKPWGSSWGRS